MVNQNHTVSVEDILLVLWKRKMRALTTSACHTVSIPLNDLQTSISLYYFPKPIGSEWEPGQKMQQTGKTWN